VGQNGVCEQSSAAHQHDENDHSRSEQVKTPDFGHGAWG